MRSDLLVLAAVGALAVAGRSRRGAGNTKAERLAKSRAAVQDLVGEIEELTERQEFILRREYRLVDTVGKEVDMEDVRIFELDTKAWDGDRIEASSISVTSRPAGPPKFVFRGMSETMGESWSPYWIGYTDSELGYVERWVPADVELEWE